MQHRDLKCNLTGQCHSEDYKYFLKPTGISRFGIQVSCRITSCQRWVLGPRLLHAPICVVHYHVYLVLYSALAQNAHVLEQHHQPRSRDTQPAMSALIHSLFLKPEGIAMLICSDLEHAVGTGVFIALFTAFYSVYKPIRPSKEQSPCPSVGLTATTSSTALLRYCPQ